MQKSHADSILSQLKGASFLRIDTRTDVKLTGGKSNPQQGRVQKVCTGSRVMIFSCGGQGGGYDNMVKRRLQAEGKDPGTFQVQPRKWGNRIEGTCYVEHNGEYYLEVIFMNAGDVHYELDGKLVPKAAIQGLPVEREPSENAQGGLDNMVQIRTYKLDSITLMKGFGQEVAA